MTLDETDKQLLTLLQEDAHLGFAELGKRVGMSVSAVNERVKKLETQGYIEHYAARINAQAVGLDLCAFIHVLVDKPEHEDRFIERMKTMPEVQECHHITGEFSYLVKVRVSNTAALEQLIKYGFKALGGIIRTQTFIVLSSPKETNTLPIT